MRYVFVGCLLLWAVAAASAEPLAVEDFFKRPDYSHVELSPDGTRVAAIVRGAKRDRLAIMNVDTGVSRPVTNFADSDIVEVHWINNRRMVFRVGDAHTASADAEYYGWYAVDDDGSHVEEIAFPAPGMARSPGLRTEVEYLRPHPRGGDDVLVEAYTLGRLYVLRWNTRTADPVAYLGGDELSGVQQWVVDHRGIPRVARTYHDGREKIWYRESAAEPWRMLEDAEEGKLKIQPRAFDVDNRTLYVAAYDGGDKLAIYRYDLANNRLGERVARHLDVDMDGPVFSVRKPRLLGFKYSAERSGVVWVDEHYARVQQMVNRALPNTVNAVSVAEENPKRALVAAYSDVAPETYYLFDAEKRTLTRFSSSRPWIDPGQMSERKFVRYKARDGLEIPAFLTIPKGSTGKNLPLVVEIHGGPWARKQTWGFDLHAQFFASRGYAVLQPDFRGTLGYGKRHFEASFGQWGFTMQDDITDGVQWLIAQGIADEKRICLFGASYGGYATLWGLMKTPDLYRCGVASVALTDISYYFKFNRWDWGRAVWADYGARQMIGDPDRDAEKWRSVSPVVQAERLKAPVLLAYGGFDQRVPISQGRALKSALDRYGKKYEWIEYPSEGHGFNEDTNRFDFYRRVDAFLKQHLKSADPANQI